METWGGVKESSADAARKTYGDSPVGVEGEGEPAANDLAVDASDDRDGQLHHRGEGGVDAEDARGGVEDGGRLHRLDEAVGVDARAEVRALALHDHAAQRRVLLQRFNVRRELRRNALVHGVGVVGIVELEDGQVRLRAEQAHERPLSGARRVRLGHAAHEHDGARQGGGGCLLLGSRQKGSVGSVDRLVAAKEAIDLGVDGSVLANEVDQAELDSDLRVYRVAWKRERLGMMGATERRRKG